MKVKVLLIAVVVLACSLGQAVAAGRYTVTAILPPRGFDYFEPRRINDAGQMIGRLDASTGPFQDSPHVGFYERWRHVGKD